MLNIQDFFLQISNSTGSIEFTTSIDVTTQILIIIAAFAAVGASIYGVITSNRRTRESNTLLEKDIDSRIRPWLIISEMVTDSMQLKNGAVYEWKKYDQVKEKDNISDDQEAFVNLMYTVTNSGLQSAKMNRIQILQWEKLSRDILNKGKKDPYPINLTPNEKVQSNVTMSIEDFRIILSQRPKYFGVNINYEWKSGNEDSVGRIWRLGFGRYEIIDSW